MPVDLQTLYPKLIHLMLDTVFVVDRDNQIVFVSDACETLLGYRAVELIGTPITDYIHPDDLSVTRASIIRVMNGHSHARDVTALRQAEEELRFMAHHDPLTALTNRSLFNDRLDSALRAAHRHNNMLALLFLDINDFKGINDVHGHAMGDQVLCMVARRLQACVRETDTVARMGGDEFTVLLTDIQSQEAVAEKVAQILATMAEPLGAEFGAINMPSCSIGVAFYPADGEDADTLLSHADGEMYRIKRQRSSAAG
jgi:diguanylate cyclase (GGDEF)-like protein